MSARGCFRCTESRENRIEALPSTSAQKIREIAKFPIAWDQLLDELPVGILVLDPSRRVMLLNRALEALTGFDSQEACGIPCWYVLRSTQCRHDCPVCQLHVVSEPLCLPGDIINRNRQKIQVRITCAVVRDQQGNLAGYLECVEDLRSAKQQSGEADQSFMLGKLLGASPEIQSIFRALPAIAQNDSPILITGETGTGKNAVAQAIHQSSNRVKGPFVKVSCGALPEHLLESELFGHRKGAFASALENKPGKFRLSHNGTIFLSEIGELPLPLQAKLLTFLDDKVVHPTGTAQEVHVDVRVIAATQRNLTDMVAQGRFREDLLSRLNVLRVHLPPLVKRGTDMRMLLDHFLHAFSRRFGKKITGFTDAAQRIVLRYPYPGNVRELRNIIEYSVNVCDDGEIRPEHLPPYMMALGPALGARVSDDDNRIATPLAKTSEQPAYVNWAEAEQQMILDAMVKAKGRRTDAAKMLGWGRSTLWRKMKRYGLAP